eukprot:6611236-Prorocentrum_lima.AAC.1
MSYQRGALPLEVNVAVRLDVDHNGKAPPSRKVFVGGLLPKFDLVSNLIVDDLNCLTCFGRRAPLA